MIKKDTIVSTTDGRLTLLQWLKKVEAALKNASATAVKAVPQADGKVVFEIDFADGTSIKSDPFELPEKLPEGYAVDGAGNVTIAGALKANNNGDVEVLKNLNVDGNATFLGKSAFIWHGAITETFEGMTVTSNVNGFFFHGPILTANGETISDPGILALTATENTAGLDFYIINPKHYNPATQELRPATVEEILSGDWSFYMSVESTDKLIKNGDDAKLKALDVNRMNCSGSDPTIDDLFKVANENITLGEIARLAKKVKYQHTVHITALNDPDKQLNLSFTARSSKNTPINSYQALHEVFGGRNLTLSGNAKYYEMQLPVYLDLHGGTMDTDKIYLSSSISVGAYQQPTLSTFPSITFTDDVVPE